VDSITIRIFQICFRNLIFVCHLTFSSIFSLSQVFTAWIRGCSPTAHNALHVVSSAAHETLNRLYPRASLICLIPSINRRRESLHHFKLRNPLLLQPYKLRNPRLLQPYQLKNPRLLQPYGCVPMSPTPSSKPEHSSYINRLTQNTVT
jgi:hypothetical protein